MSAVDPIVLLLLGLAAVVALAFVAIGAGRLPASMTAPTWPRPYFGKRRPGRRRSRSRRGRRAEGRDDDEADEVDDAHEADESDEVDEADEVSDFAADATAEVTVDEPSTTPRGGPSAPGDRAVIHHSQNLR